MLLVLLLQNDLQKNLKLNAGFVILFITAAKRGGTNFIRVCLCVCLFVCLLVL